MPVYLLRLFLIPFALISLPGLSMKDQYISRPIQPILPKEAKEEPGKQPALDINGQGRVGLTYGFGDSILYTGSCDGGITFSASQLVAELADLALGMGRGPQITSANDFTVVTATTQSGDVFAYRLDHARQKWSPAIRINDVDTIAKEGFSAVASYQNTVLAVWLDMRDNQKNKVYGAWSKDGGKSWGKNVLVYESPEGTICECCKVTAIADSKGNFYVMFRNNLKGSRDLHLISSLHGKSFGKAQKLGLGTWPLQACPMDGGDLSINQEGKPVTVWRRRSELFKARPGEAEQLLGEGKTPSIGQGSSGAYVVWQRDGEIMLTTPLLPQARSLGKGAYPKIRVLRNENAAVCVWEQEGKIKIQRVD